MGSVVESLSLGQDEIPLPGARQLEPFVQHHKSVNVFQMHQIAAVQPFSVLWLQAPFDVPRPTASCQL